MKGIEISRQFFKEYGLPMIKSEFADIENLLAFGLCGSGSECFGFDDKISADHDYEAGFCIFIPDGIDSKKEFQLSRAYNKLPKQFMGLKRNILSPVGGGRHGVIRTSTFFKERTGTSDGKLSLKDWFTIPDNYLAEATNGEIFCDNFGEITEIRSHLLQRPDDVRLKKIASHLLNMGQSGQYNYGRCVERNENGAAQLAMCEFVKSALQVIFLLNNEYMPYYKWSFRALKGLKKLSDLHDPLEFLISSDNDGKVFEIKSGIVEDIAGMVIGELKEEGITEAICGSLETHAYSVNDCIKDSNIRNMNIFSGL